MWQIGCSRLKCSGIEALSFIHTFRQLSLYSTSSTINSPPSSFADYLVQSVGLSEQQSVSTSTKLSKCRQVSDFNFANKADHVINFLKDYGFNDAQLKKIVSLYPRILLCKVDWTLKPKLKRLEELGFSGSDIVQLVIAKPNLIRCNWVPLVQTLRSVLGSDKDVVKLFKHSGLQYFPSSTANEEVVSIVKLLENEYGFSMSQIRKAVIQNPLSFFVRTSMFRDVSRRVEEEWGIPRTSPMFFHGIHVLASWKVFESNFRIFKSYGWTQLDIVTLFRQIPHCLALSEAGVRKKLDFFMEELGYGAAYLASHPSLLTYSLEKRILPRHKILLVLKEKYLVHCKSFYSSVCLSEDKFLEKYVLPYKDVIPEVLELYQSRRGHAADDKAKRIMFKKST